MYGKLSVDGKLIQAPSVVEYHSRKYVNPSSDILLALGYLPVIDDPLEVLFRGHQIGRAHV